MSDSGSDYPGEVSCGRRSGLVLFEVALLVGLFLYTLTHLSVSCLFLDTTAVGGDTPAHNYLASHLREQLFGHGRIVSWAAGWWCGFPMYQFYFCLPYVLISLLSVMIPFNIALKTVSVLGVLALPACAYGSARLLRLPRPVPALLAVAMLPFLFVKTHVMWGVNIYSTLAGMISNSISFPLMLLFIGAAYRDSEDGRFRLTTVLLMAALIASHFFTSIVAGLTVLLFPLLRPKRGMLRSLLVLAAEGALSLLLMAWWLVPLLAKGEYSMEFGVDWDVNLWKSFPGYLCSPLPGPLGEFWMRCFGGAPPQVFWPFPFILAALILGVARRVKAVWVFAWMLVLSTALFLASDRLPGAFVNIRFWPFIFFAVVALSATGIGLMISRLRATPLAVAAAFIGAVLYVERSGADAAAWAKWNFEGLERKPGWPLFRELILPLQGTPGRLANDLNAANDRTFGSTRIFEAVPYLVGKPILEGGLVNSALGSMFSYYIQGETSENSAGAPTIVTPATYDFTNAVRHLTLFNVKHFIARWPAVKQAMCNSPDWRLIWTAGDWQLFELLTHDGNCVFVPSCAPQFVRTARRKEYAMEWMYTPGALEQPYVLLRPGEDAPDRKGDEPVLTETQLRHELTIRRPNKGDISEWLYAGPFHYPTNHPDPLEFAPVDESGLEPAEGRKIGNCRWQLIFTRGPIFLNKYERRDSYLVCYNAVNIFSPDDRKAILFYTNDDDAKIWLNEREIVRSRITGLGSWQQVEIELRKGRNKLLHKCTQSVGAHFFHLVLADPAGQPFSDVVTSTRPEPPVIRPVAARPVEAACRITDERVAEDRIAFRTTGLGLPHIIKCSYYPNWKVRGARAVYWVTPGFMLVYPQAESVELHYGSTAADRMGRGLTLLAVAVLLAVAWIGRRQREGMPDEAV